MRETTPEFPVLTRSKLLTIILTALLLAFAGSGSGSYRLDQIDDRRPAQTGASSFSTLARHVTRQSDASRRELAIIITATMVDAYSQALHKSSSMRPRSQAESSKQRTWGWATSRVIASLKQQLLKLENGLPFVFHVDHLGQVLIIIEGQEFLASSPYANGQAIFEQEVVDYFFHFNDCSWLPRTQDEAQEPPEPRAVVNLRSRMARGTWLFSQHHKPVYDIGDMIRCEYADSLNRSEKAAYCHQIANNILDIVISLTAIEEANLEVNWKALLRSQPAPDSVHFSLLPGNDRFSVEPGLLSSLSTADWKRLINWLEDYRPDAGSNTTLSLKHVHSM
jgi:hypothetical protein